MHFTIPWLRRGARRLVGSLLVLAMVQALFLPAAFAGSHDTDPPTVVSAAVDGDILTVTYSEPLKEGPLASPDTYYLIRDGWGAFERRVRGGQVDGNTVTLTLDFPIPPGMFSWSVSQDSTGELTDLDGNPAVGFVHQSIAIHTTNPNYPDLVGTEIYDGRNIYIQYHKRFDTTNLPTPSDFTVTANGREVNVDRVSGGWWSDGSFDTGWVELTMAEPVDPGAEVRLTYVPGQTPIRDTQGNDAPGLTNVQVNNPSTPDWVEVNGDTLTLTFPVEMTAALLPGDAFGVWDGDESLIPVTEVTVSGAQVVLTLERTVPAAEALGGLEYTAQTAAGRLSDGAGNRLYSLWIDGYDIVNSTPATLQSAQVEGSTLTLRYDRGMSPESVPTPADFAVSRNGEPVAVDSVAIKHRKVTLTLAEPVAAGDTVTLAYTSGSAPLQDNLGNDMNALTGVPVDNYNVPVGTVHLAYNGDTEAVVASAGPGDTILLQAGIHYLTAPLVIEQHGLTLRAADDQDVWLQFAPEASSGDLIHIRGRNVTVEGLRLQVSTGWWNSAISIDSTAAGAVVRNNQITGQRKNNGYGIVVYGDFSGALTIRNNTVEDISYGIDMSDVFDAEITVADNAFSEVDTGVYVDVQSYSDMTISGNHFTSTGRGIEVDEVGGDTPDSNTLRIVNNTIGIPPGSDDTALGGYGRGIYVSEVDWDAHVVIEGNSVIGQGNRGIVLEYLGQRAYGHYGHPSYVAPLVEVRGNTLKRNQAGIYQYDEWTNGVQVLITENIIQDNHEAGFLARYDLENASVQIINNDFSSNGDSDDGGCGIVYDNTIYAAATLIIAGNVITNNAECGVFMYEVTSTNVTITGNTITGNQMHGLFLDELAQNVAVTSNEFGDNPLADLVLLGQNNRIIGNRFYGTGEMASISIHVDTTAADNQIAYNEFLGGNDGIKAVDGAETVNAALNWWGDAAGPGQSLEASAAMGDVMTEPWISGLAWTPDSLTLHVGASALSAASFATLDFEANEGPVGLDFTQWPPTSTDPTVAQVAADGTVTAAGVGTATIRTGFTFDEGLSLSVVAASVTITAPVTETREATVTVSGTANPGAVVSVGAITVTAGADGTWSAVVPLTVGENTITATNGPASASVTVVRRQQPVQPDPSGPPGPVIIPEDKPSPDDTGAQDEKSAPKPVEAEVNSTEQTEISGADWTVTVPARASRESFVLTVSPPADMTAVDQVKGAAQVVAVVELKAKGKVTNRNIDTFEQKLKVTFRYDPAQFPDPSRLAIYWYDPNAKVWVNIGGVVDSVAGTITAEVDHLTLFAALAPNEAAPVLNALPATTDQATLTVTGQAEAGSTVTLVLNGAEAATATADAAGAYSLSATLREGRNLLYVKGSGIFASNEAVVTYTPIEQEKEAEPAPNEPLLTDLSGHWAEATIKDLVRQGVVSGFEDQTFRPELTITRVQFTALIARALGLEGSFDLSSFADADAIQPWARAEVAAAVAAGIVQGRADGTFDPNANITRAEAAVMLARALQYRGIAATGDSLALSDFAAVPEWAQASVQMAVHAGIITGYQDGTFRPGNLTTRAEAAVMLSRLLKAE